jgi:hypothetical protein
VSDLFEEVEEQLRSDRYRTLVLKALPWVLAILVAAILGVGGYWGWSHYQQRAMEKASDQYAAGLDAFVSGREPQAVQLWGEVAKSPSKAYRSLALMQLGGVKLAENKPAQAVALFDQAAAAAPDDILGDAARLKSAFALMDTAPYKDVEGRLTPLMQDDRPYRAQAHEALAFAKLMAGDTAGARDAFNAIGQTLDAPEGARARARAAVQLIDSGSAKAVPAAVRLAAALPPPTPLAPGADAPLQPQSQSPGPQ